MAATFVIACPECQKQVKVAEEHIGKKAKCKGCGHVFTVKAPANAKPKAPPPPPKKGAAPPPPPPAAAPETIKMADDDDNPNPYALTKTDDSLPRCPFCAKEMASEDAIICLNCGYNTRTRMRKEVEAVYQHTGGEIFLWQLPAIACVITMIAFIVWYIIFWGLIEEWLKGSALEESDGGYVAGLSPGMFRLYHALLLVVLSVPMIRFCYKRFFVKPKPDAKKIKGE